MAFSRSRYTDARGGAFNDVGHDQLNTIIQNSYNISISLFGSGRTQHFPARSNFSGDLLRLTSAPETGRALVAVSRPHDTAASVIYTAVGLIVQITGLLVDCRDTSRLHLDLKLELTSLQNTLTLTEFAIQEYDERPLGRSLANTITPEVERCRVVLQELLDKVDDTWQGLKSTTIRKLWTGVWCSRWDGDEMVSLRKELSNSRKSLEGFLVALQSVAWIDLGNKLDAGHRVSLNKFHDLLNQRLPFLGHIKVNAIQVVNHLGDVIPVPNMFCSTWEDFHHVINGYCKTNFGNRFIEDSQPIDPSEFAGQVESGMVLEMSIVLRQRTAYQKKCPRCGYINVDVAVKNGWVHRMCPGRFQVEKVEGFEEMSDKVIDKVGREGDNERSDGRSEEGRSNEEGDEWNHDGWSHTAYDIEDDIISPAFQDQPQDYDNGTRYFRRIHVVCMNSIQYSLGVMDELPPPSTPLDPRILKLRALAHKLRLLFPLDAARLASILSHDYPDEEDFVDPRGPSPRSKDTLVHVFIDHSNILIGFLSYLRRHPTSLVGHSSKRLSHAALALILERGRSITRRVLVTSSPLYQPMESAEQLGYEVRIYARVPDTGDGMDRQPPAGATSSGDSSRGGSGSSGSKHRKNPSLSSTFNGHEKNRSSSVTSESDSGAGYSASTNGLTTTMGPNPTPAQIYQHHHLNQQRRTQALIGATQTTQGMNQSDPGAGHNDSTNGLATTTGPNPTPAQIYQHHHLNQQRRAQALISAIQTTRGMNPNASAPPHINGVGHNQDLFQNSMTSFNGHNPSSVTTIPPRIKYREQGVDELLHLKLHQAIADVDVPPPNATIVLATGDGNVAQFNEEGFLGCVRTALKKGWRVELYAWEGGLSKSWKREFGDGQYKDRFNIVGLSKFCSDLLEV